MRIGQTDKHAGMQTDRQVQSARLKQENRRSDGPADGKRDRHTDTLTDIHTVRQTGR